MPNTFKFVKKRNGQIVPFDETRITSAIMKAMTAAEEGEEKEAGRVSEGVVKALLKKHKSEDVLGIEEIQDEIESQLMTFDFSKSAKAFILYRQERANLRQQKTVVPQDFAELAEESKKYFKNQLGEFVYYRSYSRWMEKEDRRETWIESVDRYMSFMRENLDKKFTEEEYSEIREAILKQEAMPSMRLLWSAGDAARNTNISGYNCSYLAITKIQDFAEVMYLSMCGAGVGFSVEEESVQQLPQIQKQSGKKVPTHVVADSREGWGDALAMGIKTWFEGKDIDFDYSKLRPKGARLKTMGGRSSGPEPLRSAIEFARRKILSKQGRRLSTIDVHDIVCKIGEVVVMGGVRRTALISLSDLDDKDMRYAKNGQFYITDPQRAMANNSATYNEKPTASDFLDEWIALAKSGTGERGIFNRAGLKSQMPERRWKNFEEHLDSSGSNPCGEIVLRSKEFCNLSEVVARADDTRESLLRKTRIATMIGTYQSTLTNFPYLSKEWKKNCEEERLLGVSITGQWDCPVVRNAEMLREMRDMAIEVNKEYAKRFGINQSASVTCVKPSGTVSQLVDSASGLHTRYAPYYIRRIRIASTDSLFKMLKDQKIPFYPEVGQYGDSVSTYVLEFPVKAPDGSKFKNDLSAIEQLEYWKMVKENYTEHNPSVTISVGENEWIAVANWVYENWDMTGGLSFLPREDHVYALAPYEEITEEKYNELISKFPTLDFSQLVIYERADETQGAKELACAGGGCEAA